MADLSKELSKELNKDFAYCEDALGRAENAIGNLPSVQPEKRTEERTETHACDLISRQAAIDALHMHLMYRMGTDSNKKRLDEWINNLPSAQPEIIHCKECKYGVQDEDKRWYCRGFGCQVGEADGSGFCADAERRTKDEDTL